MSIWHSADELPPEDSYVVVKLTSGKCEVGFEFEYDFAHIENWAFFDDLLALETELDRTRKALDVAVDALKKIGFGCGIPPDENYAYNYINIAADAHQQITALEQKE